MPKRGKYLAYIGDKTKNVPRTTSLYRNKKKKDKEKNNIIQEIINSSLSIETTESRNEDTDKENNYINQEIIDSSLRIETAESRNEDKDKQKKTVNHSNIEVENYNDNLLSLEEKIKSGSIENNVLFNDVLNLNANNKNFKKEELCAAALVFFFSGKMSQSQFSVATKLINLVSNIKMPTSFDNVKKHICLNSEDKIKYEKYSFCSKCSLIIQTTRYQRRCVNCNNRYDITMLNL